MQLVTVWSIFVIVICILQFLYSLNMKFKKKIGHLTFNKMDFRVKCSCPLHQLFSCYQKYFVGFISVLKKRMLSFDLSVLVYPPDIILECS